MFRLLRFPLLVSLLASPLVACGEGYSTEDAQAECDALRANPPTTNPPCSEFNQVTYDQCVLCFEECGDSCAVVHTACPYTFSCPS